MNTLAWWSLIYFIVGVLAFVIGARRPKPDIGALYLILAIFVGTAMIFGICAYAN